MERTNEFKMPFKTPALLFQRQLGAHKFALKMRAAVGINRRGMIGLLCLHTEKLPSW